MKPKAQFITQLEAKLLNDDTIWELDSPLIFLSMKVGKIHVPTGFQTDFASVPRVPLAFELYGDKAHREGVVHDYLFRKDSVPNVAYMTANRVFYEAMEVRGKPWYVRWPMYLAVCACSKLCYHRRKVYDKL